jgi:hypothetical protein
MAPCDTLKKLYLISMDEVFTTLARQVICDGKSNASFVCHLRDMLNPRKTHDVYEFLQ